MERRRPFFGGVLSAPFPRRRGKVAQSGIPTHPGVHRGSRQMPPGERGVSPVGGESEAPGGKPRGQGADHFLGEVGECGSLLAMKTNEEGQRERFLAPRRENVEGEHHEVQPPGVDRVRSGGPNGILEDPRAVDPAAGLVVKGVVESEGDWSPRREVGYEEEGERMPEMVGRPSPLSEESGVGVVGPSRDGGGAPTRRKDPCGDELLEDKEGGSGEGGPEAQEEEPPRVKVERRVFVGLGGSAGRGRKAAAAGALS